MPAPTLDPLSKATVTFTDQSVTYLFRERDRLSNQVKASTSFTLAPRPVRFVFQFGGTIRHEWWTGGINYNPNGWSVFESSTTGMQEHWHIHGGKLGRVGGPAAIDHDFGIRYVERWVNEEGARHRRGGPAIIEIDFVQDGSGHIQRREQTWYHHGVAFNPDGGPMMIVDTNVQDTFTTIDTLTLLRTTTIGEREIRWMDDKNRLHRVDGPARLIMKDLIESEKDGVVGYNTPQVWHCEWHTHGKEFEHRKVMQWAHRHGITMHLGPWHFDSPFEPQDEIAYITDFVGGPEAAAAR